MIQQYINKQGKPVQQGICVMPDHYNQTFVINIKTMTPLAAERLRSCIETLFEVTKIEKTHEICVTRNG